MQLTRNPTPTKFKTDLQQQIWVITPTETRPTSENRLGAQQNLNRRKSATAKPHGNNPQTNTTKLKVWVWLPFGPVDCRVLLVKGPNFWESDSPVPAGLSVWLGSGAIHCGNSNL